MAELGDRVRDRDGNLGNVVRIERGSRPVGAAEAGRVGPWYLLSMWRGCFYWRSGEQIEVVESRAGSGFSGLGDGVVEP